MQFEIEGKKIKIYLISAAFADDKQSIPAIYLNSYSDAGEKIAKMLQRRISSPFTLIVISGLKWDSDMCPWECPPTSKNDTPCFGGADDYLAVLEEKIIPRVEDIAGAPSWRGIAGYSLGGLFALYAQYRTDIFSRAASMSGSLWYPGWLEYAEGHETVQKPECVYLSLGDKESATRNKYLKSVQERTEAYFSLLKSRRIDAQFTLNPGNHFADANGRTAAGIEWILTR